ncbi:MAG TPA: GNAT family N-acetyltransferase [Saprospiraceae bacterium]|nr:GNAT family N-acetyltransferase [Saprospiraceae bacterium]HPN72044.1 GNAT family N-acetyltransferase [Saprospiraceae bacterium]
MKHNKDINLMFSTIDFGSSEYEESIILRDLVLRKPLGMQFLPEDLAAEYDSFHLVIKEHEEIIACLVLKPIDQKILKMRQVAVHPTRQGKNIGRQLVEFSEAITKSKGYDTIELHARKTAVPFYLRLGYEIIGDEFLEVNIPHFKMIKNL